MYILTIDRYMLRQQCYLFIRNFIHEYKVQYTCVHDIVEM